MATGLDRNGNPSENTVDYTHSLLLERQASEIAYAIDQLQGIDLERLAWQVGQRSVADRIRRALDALERIQEAHLSDTLEMEIPTIQQVERQ